MSQNSACHISGLKIIIIVPQYTLGNKLLCFLWPDEISNHATDAIKNQSFTFCFCQPNQRMDVT
jgi:hypothetical protein